MKRRKVRRKTGPERLFDVHALPLVASYLDADLVTDCADEALLEKMCGVPVHWDAAEMHYWLDILCGIDYLLKRSGTVIGVGAHSQMSQRPWPTITWRNTTDLGNHKTEVYKVNQAMTVEETPLRASYYTHAYFDPCRNVLPRRPPRLDRVNLASTSLMWRAHRLGKYDTRRNPNGGAYFVAFDVDDLCELAQKGDLVATWNRDDDWQTLYPHHQADVA